MPDQTSLDLAANLKLFRERRQLSQREVATLSGVPRPTLAHIERGAGNPTLGVLVKLAGALGCSIEELIGPRRSAGRHYPVAALPSRTRGNAVVRELLVEPIPGLAIERLELPKGESLNLRRRAAGTRQYLTCEAGELEVELDGESWHLAPGDVVVSRGDLAHLLHNRGRGRAVAYAMVTPAPPGG